MSDVQVARALENNVRRIIDDYFTPAVLDMLADRVVAKAFDRAGPELERQLAERIREQVAAAISHRLSIEVNAQVKAELTNG